MISHHFDLVRHLDSVEDARFYLLCWVDATFGAASFWVWCSYEPGEWC